MRVLHVMEAMNQGGAESLILEHVRHAGLGVETVVVALNRGGPALEQARALGAKTLVLEKGKGHWAGLRRLADLVRAERIEVVNGHNPTGALYATLAARAAGVAAVVRTEHSIHYAERHSRLYQTVLEPALTGLAARVICVCEAARASHARRMAWADRRFVTVLNGISDGVTPRAREAVRRELGLADADRVLLAVGSLTRQKAHATLIEAFASVAAANPRARLVIAGEGPLRAQLEAEIASAGAASNRVHLIGARTDVPDLMHAADAFVLSSIREGLSVTLLESMRAARPAVVTRIGGNPEAVVHRETGLVVDADAGALAHGIAQLLDDPDHADRLGRAARARFVHAFTAERMVRETEAVYREALGGAHAAARPARAGDHRASA